MTAWDGDLKTIPEEILNALSMRAPNILGWLRALRASALDTERCEALNKSGEIGLTAWEKVARLLGFTLLGEDELRPAAVITAQVFLMSIVPYEVPIDRLRPALEARAFQDSISRYIANRKSAGEEYSEAIETAAAMIQNLAAMVMSGAVEISVQAGQPCIAVPNSRKKDMEAVGMLEIIQFGDAWQRELVDRVTMPGNYIVTTVCPSQGFTPSIFISKN